MSEQRDDVYRVGSVWRTSWGYDQTNVEFFEVVKETRASVVLRRVKSTGYAESAGADRVFPATGADRFTTDVHLMGNSEEYDREAGGWKPAAAYERDRARGYSEKVCRKGRGGLRIDDVRYAWPYEGGGAYETAVGWGH